MRRREPLDPDHAAQNEATPETRRVVWNHTFQRTAQTDSGETNLDQSPPNSFANLPTGCPLVVVGHPSRVKVEEPR